MLIFSNSERKKEDVELNVMFFHDMEELFSFLQKEYGSTWYNRVSVKVLDRSSKVEDGKSMIEVRISELDEMDGELSFEEIKDLLKSEDNSIEESDREVEENLKEYAEPRVVISISSGSKKAYATIYPGIEREMPSGDEILKIVENKGIKYGLKKEEIEKAVEKRCILKPFLIAEGTNPANSKDAQLKLLFPSSGVKLKKIDEEDKVDYASMYEVVHCYEGERLAIKIPSKKGESGYDVFGKETPSKEPKEINLLKFVGENVKLSKDGNSIVSSVNGQPYFSKEKKINVREIYVVEGDLDYSIGNIDFLGTIWIKGNAEEEFKIKAGKDVIIDGIVGEVDVEATGSVIIKGGVFGKLKGKIVSHKDFKAKFLNEAFIISYGDVSIDEYIMNSRVISKGNVVVRGKGWITGESVKASGDVITNVIGSISKVPTHISAGINFEFSRKAEEVEISLQSYLTKLGEISSMINKTLSAFKKITDGIQKGNLLSFAKRLEKRKTEVLEEIERLKNESKVLRRSVQIDESEKNSKVIVKKKCFEGARITIANETITIHSDIGPTIFSLDQLKRKIIASPSKSWNDESKD